MSSTTGILHLFSQETGLLIKVTIKCVNIKLWDILGCFHYILNPPRSIKLISFLTIVKRGSKFARNSDFDCDLSPVGRQIAIEISVSNDF